MKERIKERRKGWKGIGKHMKERLKISGRNEEYDIGNKCQEDRILGRQAFKWSLEPSCFDFQLRKSVATSYSM